MTGYVYPRPEDEQRYPFEHHRIAQFPPDEQQQRGEAFIEAMRQRRSVRTFDTRPVPQRLMEVGTSRER